MRSLDELNPPQSVDGMVRFAYEKLRDRLPSDWVIQNLQGVGSSTSADAAFMLSSPDGLQTKILIETKRLLETRDIPRVREQIVRNLGGDSQSIGMVVARYLSKSTREKLAKAGMSYVDATGNMYVRTQAPAVFISDRGADKDPWRGPGRPRGTLQGAPAAKVVRALLDFPGPWKIRELVKVSKASTGSVYRVIEFLESEALITRGDDGLIVVLNWTKLLRRWSEDYQFLRTNPVTRWIAPRGLESFIERVREDDDSVYAVTGSIAAASWEAYAPTRSAMLYSTNPERSAANWGLRPAESGVNVLLAQPAYDVVFERTIQRSDGLRLVAPTQVAVDLMTGPGRAPSEAEELLNWMESNERSWR